MSPDLECIWCNDINMTELGVCQDLSTTLSLLWYRGESVLMILQIDQKYGRSFITIAMVTDTTCITIVNIFRNECLNHLHYPTGNRQILCLSVSYLANHKWDSQMFLTVLTTSVLALVRDKQFGPEGCTFLALFWRASTLPVSHPTHKRHPSSVPDYLSFGL